MTSTATIDYFAYGSNMDTTSLAAKGVEAERSTPAVLPGWSLVFDIPSLFASEGTVANIRPRAGARVHGVLHRCHAGTLERCDALEGAGLAYERRRVAVESYEGERIDCFVYSGLPPYVTTEAPTSQRYLSFLLRGARAMGLDPSYVQALATTPVLARTRPGPFRGRDLELIELERFCDSDELTALAGLVFRLADAPAQWRAYLGGFAAGEDLAAWILSRQPQQDRPLRPSQIERGELSDWQLDVVNTYLHDLAALAPCVGRLAYASALPFGAEARS